MPSSRFAPEGRKRDDGAKWRANPIRLLPGIDIVMVTAAWMIAYSVMGQGGGLLRSAVRAGGLGCLAFLLAHQARLYNAAFISDRRVEAARVLRLGAGTGVLALAAPIFTTGSTHVIRAGLGGLLSIVMVSLGRAMLHAWLRNERAAGRHVEAVVVVGYRDEAERLIELISNRPDLGMRVCALAGDWETAFKHELNWLGWPGDTAESLAAAGATGVVISPAGMPPAEFNAVTHQLARRGVKIFCSTGLQGVGHARLQRTALANESFFSVAPPASPPLS